MKIYGEMPVFSGRFKNDSAEVHMIEKFIV